MIEGAAVAFSLAAHERMNSIWHGEPDRILEDHHGCGGMGGGYCIDPADWVGRDGCPVQGSESHTAEEGRSWSWSWWRDSPSVLDDALMGGIANQITGQKS